MDGWRLGDLSPSGVGLTLGYALLACGCLIVAGHGVRPGAMRPRFAASWRTTWTMLATALAVVTVERQVGLLNLIAAVLRVQAEADGRYATRGPVQMAASAAIGAGALIVGIAAAAMARGGGWRAVVMAMLATATLAYLAAKAVSLHALDRILFRRIAGIAVGNGIELALAAAGLAIVTTALVGRRGDGRG